jgi:apolipoprotein N-acyltransferase
MDVAMARRPSAGQLTWLWLLIGFLLLPFTAYQGVIPLAAWIAPVFLLRFARTTAHGRLGLFLVFLAYAASVLLGERGTTGGGIDMAWGLTAYPLIYGALYTLPYAADRAIGSRLGMWPRLFVFPTAFVSLIWAMTLLHATDTFGSPAYSQGGDLVLMQLASVTGMWGVIFLIAWFATTINCAWEHAFRGKGVSGPLLAFATALVAVILFGVVRLALPAPASPTVEVAAVTADSGLVDAATKDLDLATFFGATDAQRSAARPKLEATVDAMLARTETALLQGARLVAWQEDAVWVLEEDRQATIDRASALAKAHAADLPITLSVLTRVPGLPYLRNESILIDETGRVLATYEKSYPTFPGEWLATIPGSGDLPVVDTPYGRLSTAICHDVAYPGLLHQAGANGVDVLFVPTHTAFAVWAAADASEASFRNIENGFAMVRPTGNGPTLITDPVGRTIASADYVPAGGILAAAIPTRGQTTVYGRIGDAFAYLCLLALAGLTTYALIRGRRTVAVGRPVSA